MTGCRFRLRRRGARPATPRPRDGDLPTRPRSPTTRPGPSLAGPTPNTDARACARPRCCGRCFPRGSAHRGPGALQRAPAVAQRVASAADPPPNHPPRRPRSPRAARPVRSPRTAAPARAHRRSPHESASRPSPFSDGGWGPGARADESDDQPTRPIRIPRCCGTRRADGSDTLALDTELSRAFVRKGALVQTSVQEHARTRAHERAHERIEREPCSVRLNVGARPSAPRAALPHTTRVEATQEKKEEEEEKEKKKGDDDEGGLRRRVECAGRRRVPARRP